MTDVKIIVLILIKYMILYFITKSYINKSPIHDNTSNNTSTQIVIEINNNNDTSDNAFCQTAILRWFSESCYNTTSSNEAISNNVIFANNEEKTEVSFFEELSLLLGTNKFVFNVMMGIVLIFLSMELFCYSCVYIMFDVLFLLKSCAFITTVTVVGSLIMLAGVVTYLAMAILLLSSDHCNFMIYSSISALLTELLLRYWTPVPKVNLKKECIPSKLDDDRSDAPITDSVSNTNEYNVVDNELYEDKTTYSTEEKDSSANQSLTSEETSSTDHKVEEEENEVPAFRGSDIFIQYHSDPNIVNKSWEWHFAWLDDNCTYLNLSKKRSNEAVNARIDLTNATKIELLPPMKVKVMTKTNSKKKKAYIGYGISITLEKGIVNMKFKNENEQNVWMDSLSQALIKKDCDSSVTDEGCYDDDIRFVMEQAECTKSKAIEALRNNNNDLVNTIMELTN